MSYWIVALAVWVSAGGRIGRVLVRPATTVRMAIVVAVAAVAAASTATIPDVAQAIDSAAELRVQDPRLSDAQAVAAWAIFTAATAVVAVAAWPIASRRNLWHLARGVYAVGITAAVLALTVTPLIGWVAIVVGCAFVCVTGLRNLAWNPLGRGIGLYTIGALVVLVLAAVQIVRTIQHGVNAARHPTPQWAWSAAALFIATGAVWILVEVSVRARILMRRIEPLHTALVARFPEVVAEDPKKVRSVSLRASDQVAHVMDALYLQSGGGASHDIAADPPERMTDRAIVVARWVRDPSVGMLDARSVAPPPGASARRWVSAIAKAYREDTPAAQPALVH
jgi:hypothetical protein